MTEILELSPDTVHIHYEFTDNSHSMNASVQNRCEAEVLKIFKEIASTFKVEYEIEILTSVEGGYIDRLKIKLTKDTFTGQMVMNTFTALLTIGSGLALYYATTDFEKKALDKQLVRVQLHNERSDSAKVSNAQDLKIIDEQFLEVSDKENVKAISDTIADDVNYSERQDEVDSVFVKFKELADSTTIRKKRSNFYSILSEEQKVKSVGFNLLDGDQVVFEETFVKRSDFNKHILLSDDLEPLEDDDAIIEITSPVLKVKSKGRWRGIYKGLEIPFKMESKEFLKLVHTGAIEFKNGFQIECTLIGIRKTDEEGNPRITGYSVSDITRYNISDNPMEIIKEKKEIKKKEKLVTKSFQLDLFGAKPVPLSDLEKIKTEPEKLDM